MFPFPCSFALYDYRGETAVYPERVKPFPSDNLISSPIVVNYISLTRVRYYYSHRVYPFERP
jgi:hypothetical protein